MANINGSNQRRKDRVTNVNGVSYIGNEIWSPEHAKNIQEANKNLEIHIAKLEKLKQAQKNFNAEKAEELRITKSMLELNQKNLDTWGKYQEKYVKSSQYKSAQSRNIVANLPAQSGGPTINNISQWLGAVGSNKIASNQQKEADAIYNRIAKSQWNSFKRQGNSFSDQAAVDKTNAKINELAAKEIGASASKYSKATSLLNSAVAIFDSAVKTWKQVALDGIRNQTSAYENTFENISVRNGITRSQYYKSQAGLNNTLGSMGLRNNIASSDVQNMWNSLAGKGIAIDMSTEEKRAQVTAKAIETVLTGKIVPYLDVTSTVMQQFSDLQPNFMKQLRGIGVATMDMSGSSVVANTYLQDMVDNLSPMAALAENELGTQFAKATGAYEAFRAQGMSDYEIGELYKGAESTYRDPYRALQSGNLEQALAVTGGVRNNIDFTDYSAVNAEYLKAAGFVGGLLPSNNITPILAGTLPSGLSAMTLTGIAKKKYDINSALATGDLTGAMLNYYSNRATSDYTNDQNQTNQQLQTITVENFMNELSVIDEWLGHWAKVITTAISAVGAIVLTNSVGNWIKGGLSKGAGQIPGQLSLFGGGGGGISAGGLFSTAAGIAGIAAGTQGVMKGHNQLKYGASTNYNDSALMSGIGTANTLGGASAIAGGTIVAGGAIAGMLGVGAANAWNPVGWGLLIAGAAAMIGAAVAETIDMGTDANKVFNQLQDATKKRADEMRREADEELSFYKQYQSLIKQTTDLTTAKKLAEEAGIATEKELQDSKYDEISAVQDLVNEFIIAKQKLSDDVINAYEDFSTTINKQTADFSAEYLNKFVGKNYNIQSGDDTWSVNKYGQQMQSMAYDFINEGLISQSGEDLTDGDNQVAKHLAYMVKNGLLEHNYRDGNLTGDDYDILFRTGVDKDRRLVGEYMLSQDKYRNNMLQDESTQTITGHKYKVYSSNAAEYLKNYISDLLVAAQSGDKEAAEEALLNMKLLGITSLDELGDSKTTIQNAMEVLGIKSFRTGLSYVPYDKYLASLHEGEAVLTASTANELRNLIDVYRQSQNAYINMEAIVQAQTTVLCAKIDEVITTINTGSPAGYNSGLASSVGQSMRAMSSLHGI